MASRLGGCRSVAACPCTPRGGRRPAAASGPRPGEAAACVVVACAAVQASSLVWEVRPWLAETFEPQALLERRVAAVEMRLCAQARPTGELRCCRWRQRNRSPCGWVSLGCR